MNRWRHLFFCLLFLIIATVSPSPVAGEETGFRQYRESMLKQIEDIKAALEKDPSDAQTHFQLGLAYMALGRHGQETAEYLEAVRLQPDFAEAHFNLGLSYDLLADGALAIQHMLKARQIYSAHKDHRRIRTTQRVLRTFYSKYGFQPEGSARRK